MMYLEIGESYMVKPGWGLYFDDARIAPGYMALASPQTIRMYLLPNTKAISFLIVGCDSRGGKFRVLCGGEVFTLAFLDDLDSHFEQGLTHVTEPQKEEENESL